MGLKRLLRKSLTAVREHLMGGLDDQLRQNAVLVGRVASHQVRRLKQITSLDEVEFRVFSQWGEDGIIDWLVERIEPPVKAFVEFGVENYTEANTRFLLQNRNWRGLVIDGSPAHIEFVRRDPVHWQYDLRATAAFVTRDNINRLITDAGFTGELGLLSVDVDGVDYWIWESITVVRPIIVVCEYNALFGDLLPVTVPYDERFVCSDRHFSRLYYGASVGALTDLARRKGYQLVGTNSTGVNVFFVRDDYAAKVLPLIGDTSPRATLVRQSRDEHGALSFAAGRARFDLISHLPVVDVRTGITCPLAQCGPAYSDSWKAAMGFDGV